MPSARELLEQADALMRRNRRRGRFKGGNDTTLSGEDATLTGEGRDVPTLTDALAVDAAVPLAPTLVLPDAGVAAGTADDAHGAGDAGTAHAVDADPISLDTLADLPVLTDAVVIADDAERRELACARRDAGAAGSGGGCGARRPKRHEPGRGSRLQPRGGARGRGSPPRSRRGAAVGGRGRAAAAGHCRCVRRPRPGRRRIHPRDPAGRGRNCCAGAGGLGLGRKGRSRRGPGGEHRGRRWSRPSGASRSPGDRGRESRLGCARRRDPHRRCCSGIDLFTDTGLREQLGARLQPIVERASAELVDTINRQVGELMRELHRRGDRARDRQLAQPSFLTRSPSRGRRFQDRQVRDDVGSVLRSGCCSRGTGPTGKPVTDPIALRRRRFLIH